MGDRSSKRQGDGVVFFMNAISQTVTLVLGRSYHGEESSISVLSERLEQGS